jgi:hypothetical protein
MEPAGGGGAGFPSSLSEAADAQVPTTGASGSGVSLGSVYPLASTSLASGPLDVIGGPHHHAMRSVASMSHLQQQHHHQPPESPHQQHLAQWGGPSGYSSQYVSASLPSARQWDLSAYLEPGPTQAASSAASYYRERAAEQHEAAQDEQQQSPSRYGHIQQTSRA